MPNYTSGEGSSDSSVFDDGEYDFETIGAKEKLSKTSNNAQIELRNEFSDGNGQKIIVHDYLVFTKKSAWKIDQYRQATGDTLIRGECAFEAEDCIGRKGRAYLYVEEYNGKPRNKVDYYVVPNGRSKKQTKEDNPF